MRFRAGCRPSCRVGPLRNSRHARANGADRRFPGNSKQSGKWGHGHRSPAARTYGSFLLTDPGSATYVKSEQVRTPYPRVGAFGPLRVIVSYLHMDLRLSTRLFVLACALLTGHFAFGQ